MTLPSVPQERLAAVPAYMLALVDDLVAAAALAADRGAGPVVEARRALLSALTIPAAWADIAMERAAARDPAHEDGFRKGEIAAAASHYLAAASVAEWLGTPKFGGGPIRGLPRPWPFAREEFRDGPVREILVRAAVYTLAAIERIDRAAPFTLDHAATPAQRLPKPTRNARRRAAARARKRDAAAPQPTTQETPAS